MKNGPYHKEGTGAWELAESEQKPDVIMSREEAATCVARKAKEKALDCLPGLV